MDMEQFFYLPTLKYGDYIVKNKVLYCTTYFEFVTETWSSSVLHITLILAPNDRINYKHPLPHMASKFTFKRFG